MTTITKKTMLLASLAGVSFFAWFFFLLLPLQNTLYTKHRALLDERIQSEIAKLQERDIQSTLREFERLQSTTEDLQAYFLTEERVLAFISSLESLAQQNSVSQEIQNLQPPSGDSNKSTFQLAIEGTFPSILSYLYGLERLPTYVSLDRLQFTNPSDSRTAPLTLQLSANIIWQ
jgi:hypothetical protein